MHSARYLGDQSVNFSLLGAPVVGDTVGELGRGQHNNGYSSYIRTVEPLLKDSLN